MGKRYEQVENESTAKAQLGIGKGRRRLGRDMREKRRVHYGQGWEGSETVDLGMKSNRDEMVRGQA